MGKRHLRKPQPDLTAVLGGLRLPDEQARVKALHAVCPCAAGFRLYERLRGEVRRLQKDPSPRVRAIAMHVEQDAGRSRRSKPSWTGRASGPDTVNAPATATGSPGGNGAGPPGTGFRCDP